MGDELKEMKEAENEGMANDKGNTWIVAVILILVGIGLLVSNFTSFTFDNWWALFLLIPAIAMLRNVWVDYQENGRLTSKCTGPLIGGLAILVTVVIFLFNLSWSGLWPLAFVFGGIAVLLSSRR